MCCCVTLSTRLQTVSGARVCIALTFDTEAKKLSQGKCAQLSEECAILAIVRRVRNTCNS